MLKQCTINGKALRSLYANGKLVYASYEDQCEAVNDYALSACGMESPNALSTDSYTFNGQTYNYTVYETYRLPSFCTLGAGNTNPWFVAEGIVATAAHWGGSLKTGTWTNTAESWITYDISGWTNLREWALGNGWTEEQLRGMSDIGDVVVARNGANGTGPDRLNTPYFISKELVRKYFYKGSLAGTLAWHAPQKSVAIQGSGYAVPVVMQRNHTWQTPKAGYSAIDSRSAELKTVCENMQPTYLAYTGDSGKPTWFMLGDKPVVVSQCYSQFAGPDFTACLPVLKAYVAAVGSYAINEITESDFTQGAI